MARFPGPAHRTGHAGFPHPALGLVSRPGMRHRRENFARARTPPASWPGRKAPSEASGDRRSSQANGQSPLLGSVQSTQNQGPFPPPALPGFLGNMGPSDAHLGLLPSGVVEGQRLPRLDGPPVLRRALSLRATPTTPASHSEARRLYGFRVQRPSPRYSRVGTRDCSFGACSGFTRVAARRFAGPPYESCCPGGLTTPVTRKPPTRSYEAVPPTASAGLSPARTRHLSRRTITSPRFTNLRSRPQGGIGGSTPFPACPFHRLRGRRAQARRA